ncbi:hypothetical protein LE181_22350 [Streptomyces sp. SCA3-4]|uniref:hypothetical protein n=1 Tax=Streptomyces sichuanensis TaxID=2871810 RepID=UPI001CE37983|nr:hypothetical protein [Streptomyces sichuanensis]MCA6094900.1 hypothetical protein [Streptomyces sichuanensis]
MLREAAVDGPGQSEALRELDAEGGNLRAALDAAVREGATDEALRLVAALSRYWLLRGRLGEGRRSARAALEAAGDGAAARASAGAPLPPAERGDVDRITAAARAVLGAAAFRKAFEQGAAQGPGGLAERSTLRTPPRTPALPVPAGGR